MFIFDGLSLTIGIDILLPHVGYSHYIGCSAWVGLAPSHSESRRGFRVPTARSGRGMDVECDQK
jgi:hypothetical protein